MSSLSRLYVHPVKSMRALQVSHALAGAEGLAADRIFMVTDPAGTFITARQYPRMLLFTPVMLPGGLHLIAPDGQSISLSFTDFTRQALPTEVWGNHFTAYQAPEAINNWLSGYFDRQVTLRWTGEDSSRRVKPFPAVPLSFADGFPYLLVNEASVQDLQQRCPAGVSALQFRPNLVVSGVPAYDEDSWQQIRIGSAEFEAVKPCSRCVLTTVSVEGGYKHPDGEPLSTLQAYRSADNGDIDFGQNLIVTRPGVVRAGDKVEVLSRRAPRRYIIGTVTQRHTPAARAAATVSIDYRGQCFDGNNQHVVLDQLEQQGICVPYSCRAGICGRCEIQLLQGEVTPLTSSATDRPGYILSCSCIPKGPLRLA